MTTFEEKVINDINEQLDEDWMAKYPRAALLVKRHEAAIARLRNKYPNLIIVEGLDALGDYLRYHTWCQKDILDVFPWKPILMNRLLGKKLPFILNTQIVRLRYKDVFKEWPLERVNAQNLYAPQDLLAWFRKNLNSSIETVMVPLTMFARNANAMRDTFKRVRDAHLNVSYQQTTSRKLREISLVFWPEFQACIRPEFINEVGKLFDDKAAYAEKQGCTPRRAKLRSYEVKLPTDKMPKFFDLTGISATTRNGYRSKELSASSFRDFAWARHEIRQEAADDDAPVRKVGYTQGMWIGGVDAIQDYADGLVEVMSAERFVKLFGESALKEADWRFSKDLCAWAEPDAVFGPGLPPKEMGVMMGANFVAPKEKLP